MAYSVTDGLLLCDLCDLYAASGVPDTFGGGAFLCHDKVQGGEYAMSLSRAMRISTCKGIQKEGTMTGPKTSLQLTIYEKPIHLKLTKTF
jgi:galactose-1-phosphate uridylyltransferase